ncbi:NAD-dependent epimerase/dehydratase family protein [Alphaproteobacteria bacterium]|jgi:UDP-glucose 4-epimerase|nr:NAD-dependent epimerase/dehydratase family protein [Alphaproteobacteria bacterium]
MVNSKKIKLTIIGSSGFLGSNFIDILDKKKFDVTAYDLIKANSPEQKKCKFIKGDILDYDTLSRSIEGADYVFNFAGEADITENIKKVENTFKSNLIGNINILTLCNKYKIKKYIYASSMYVFGKYGSFYKISKIASEELIREFNNLYGLKYNILRFGSLFGSAYDKKSAILNMINEAIKKKEITYNGQEDSLRQYIHIKDACKATLKSINKKYDNQLISIIGRESYRVKDVMILISEMLNKKVKFNFKNKKNQGHYRITPFSFEPKIGVTINLDDYIDIQQALYEEIKRISNQKN